MPADPNPPPALDDATLAFAGRVFQYARMGHAEELAELFGQGLPANLRNDKGDSLLMLAAYNGQPGGRRASSWRPEATRSSPTTGARRRSRGAAFKGEMEIARLLLAHGARPWTASATAAAPRLMTAAMFNRTEMVELLLAHGADPDRRDAGGAEPPSMAQAMGAADTPAQLARAPRPGA